MTRTRPVCTILALLFLSPVALSLAGLSPPAQEIVDYLMEDWLYQFRSTSIPVAMRNLGIPEDDHVRIEVGEHFRQNPKLHKKVTYWGANNFILSGEEKQIAKWLFNSYERQGRLPELAEIAAVLNTDVDRVRERLEFMARVGLLQESDKGLGFELSKDYAIWGGPLRFNFHTVTIGDQKLFDVFWGVDYLLVVTRLLNQKDTVFRLDDSCAHCGRPITIEVVNEEIKTLEPETVFVQKGGSWTVDNFFWSEEHLNEWLEKYPAYKRLRQMPVSEMLEDIKSNR